MDSAIEGTFAEMKAVSFFLASVLMASCAFEPEKLAPEEPRNYYQIFSGTYAASLKGISYPGFDEIYSLSRDSTMEWRLSAPDSDDSKINILSINRGRWGASKGTIWTACKQWTNDTVKEKWIEVDGGFSKSGNADKRLTRVSR